LSLDELIEPEDIEPEDIAPEDMGSEDIAPWAACFFFLFAVAKWSPEAIASPLDISSPDDMEPLAIALLELEELFDIASMAEVCATAAPATPTLKTKASPVILAHRSI